MSEKTTPQTMFEKIWSSHVVRAPEGQQTMLYVDLHLAHEVTSPQAFEGLRISGRKVRRPDKTFAVADHNVPTTDRSVPIRDEIARKQIETLKNNASEFGITYFDLHDLRQGVVHVMGPEQGLTQPGMVIVCGDSHTATHGAFGALAFGIGTSEVEHVLATETLLQYKPQTMEIQVTGHLPQNATAKDLILYIIGKLTTQGGTGYCLEYTGEAIRALSMEQRMTVCNMSIEAGARAGMIAPDDTTFRYLEGRPYAPADFNRAVEYWKQFRSDPGATYDRVFRVDASCIRPQVTWGTNPGQVTSIDGVVPSPEAFSDETERRSCELALKYMDLKPGMNITDIPIDFVFIGSCTNGRLEDLRAAAAVIQGRKVAPNVTAIVVPGTGLVKQAAEKEGLHNIFIGAGFQWREPGCSMCLAMNPDRLAPGQRCASTSNRNFEGRQGKGGRTHLVSPQTAAKAALAGHFTE